jgi:hypothetical protein
MKTMAYYQVCNTATESVVVERHLFKSSKHAIWKVSSVCILILHGKQQQIARRKWPILCVGFSARPTSLKLKLKPSPF